MSTNMKDVFDREFEKLDEKFLDLKMELVLSGWSSRLAHKVWDFKRESEEFERLSKMTRAYEEDSKNDIDPSEEQMKLASKKNEGAEPEYMI